MIGGYEPKSSEAFFKRTRRELGRFADTWDIATEMEAATLSSDEKIATARIQTETDSGPVSTRFNFFVWNEIVLSDFSKPTVVRVAKYVRTFADYVLSGTFSAIVKQAWRFSAYFLYPALALAVITLVSASFAIGTTQLPMPGATAIGIVSGIAAWLGLLKLTGRRWFVLHLMDLWSFSCSYLHQRRPDANALIERFADAVAECARSGEDDEIVLVGHSTGGALILDIAATAIAKYPQLGQGSTSVTILTVGSTSLKIGLHPAAEHFRGKVKSIVDSKSVNWIECQAMTDVINFYKTDPVAAMNLKQRSSHQVPQVHLVRIKDMLQSEAYKRFRYNFFRVHYQFVMANTKQYAYDFFVMCCSDRRLADSLGTRLLYPPRAAEVQAENDMANEHDEAPAVASGKIAA
ncbi:MAG: membrane protein [Aureliella sp.]